MALSTQLQQAQALMKEKGLTLSDAVSQVRSVATPAPPPIVTPPPFTPIPPQMNGVNGETFQVAPINQDTGLSSPAPQQAQAQIPSAPVAPVTPTLAQATSEITPSLGNRGVSDRNFNIG